MSNPSAWWFWWDAPSGTPQAFIPSPLRLSDFLTAGRGVIEVLALFEAEPDAQDFLWNADSGVGSIVDPASDITVDSPAATVLDRIRRLTGNVLNFTRDSGSLSDAFGSGGPFENGTVYVQTKDGLAVFPVADTLHQTGDNYLQLNIPTAAQPIISGIADGDRFIVAMARPAAMQSGDGFLWGTDEFRWGTDRFRWAA